MKPEKSAEVIVGRLVGAEGPNTTPESGTSSLMKERAPEKTTETSEVDLHGSGRKRRRVRVSGASLSGAEADPNLGQPDLIEKMLERGNLLKALQAVERTRRVFEDLDQWLRRRLRCLEWRKWKRGRTRYRKLLALGFTPAKARVSAFNGRGPWWNAGAQHLNAALPTAHFRRLGLGSLLEEVDGLTALRAARSL